MSNGLGMQVGASHKLVYVGSSYDLEVVEKAWFNRTMCGGDGTGDDARRVEPQGVGPEF